MSGIAYAWIAIGAFVLGLVAPPTSDAATAGGEAGPANARMPRLTFHRDPRPTNGGQMR
jgi:hypothetical protein